ncbi:MAG: aldehyde dehydrogenase family protein [Sphingobacteriales bacterium JAD_PAG50586_3]|nr:MAG: aldehyde dehydrogenase family protein [Sphingobacteriales bacterium JAD_PAG50586_3]
MQDILAQLGIADQNAGTSTGLNWLPGTGNQIVSYSPVDGQSIATAETTSRDGYDKVVKAAAGAFTEWRNWPAPKRGEVVRQLGRSCVNTKSRWVNWYLTKWAKACKRALAKFRR